MSFRLHRPRGRLPIAVSTLALAVAGLSVPTATPASAAVSNPTQYVNPFIGTDDSNAPNPLLREARSRRTRSRSPRAT